ncbi:MAG: cytochrome c maturation protein CcmE [Gemmatimonadota bacterium]
MSDGRRRRVGLALGTIIVLAGFGYLLYGGIGGNLVYFLTPSEMLAKGGDIYESPLRLGGQVVPGTVEWDSEALDLRFRVSDGTDTVRVHSEGAPPQMFRDGIGVIVEGRYTRAGVFESTNLMVKHSNEYRAPEEGHRPEEMYRSLIREEAR